MTLDEAIKHEEEIVKEEQYAYQECVATHNTEGAMNCRKYAEEHIQLAEWLKELKTHREIHDVLLQMIVDFDLDICCDDLMDNEEEQKICEENCTSKTKGCWVRWAKMKAMEKCKNANLLEQEPCEDTISRKAVLDLFNKSDEYSWEMGLLKKKKELDEWIKKRKAESEDKE